MQFKSIFSGQAIQHCNRLFRIAGITVAAVIGASFYLANSMLHQELEQTQMSLATSKSLIEDQANLNQELQLWQSKLQQLEINQSQVNAKIPHELNETELLRTVAQLAQENRFALTDFRPGRTGSTERLKFREFQLTGSASYAVCCQFLAGLQQLPSTNQIQQCQITASADTHDVCQVTLLLHLFYGQEQP